MKKLLSSKVILTVLLTIAGLNAQSQWINSITHFPANPTSIDTIYFYADLSFPSGSCDQHTQFSGVINQDIFAGAIHCLGMLTFICSYTDTFKIDPLPAGNYNFTLQVDYGALPSPCVITGNGAADSIGFTVTSASSVPFIANGNQDLLIFPNPAGNIIKLQMSNEILFAKNKSLIIYSMEGKEIGEWKLESTKKEEEINISGLSGGIYLCKIVTENTVSGNVKLIVIK